jgi:hypothetical protein
MTRFSIPALASVSVLALGLIAAPATIDLQDEVIGAKAAWAKGNGGNGGGGGHGGGQGHGRDKAGKSGETEVSSVETEGEAVDETAGEEEEEAPTGKSLPQTAIDGKTHSSAYHSANYVGGDATATSSTGKTVNSNSAVFYSREEGTPDTPEAGEGEEGGETATTEDEVEEGGETATNEGEEGEELEEDTALQ